MTQAGIPVPGGYVVLSETFEKFIHATNLFEEIDSILDKVDHKAIHTIDQASEDIRSLILSRAMPDEIKTEIMESFAELNAEFVAVRSSATAEDGTDHAWAGQLASLIQKYVSVLPRWKELMKTDKYSESLERYMGTHASVQEAFLAKLIEVTDGVEARDSFISMIGANGFGYIEGFEAEVTSNEKDEPVVHISYSTEKGKFKKDISPEILEQIIQK